LYFNSEKNKPESNPYNIKELPEISDALTSHLKSTFFRILDLIKTKSNVQSNPLSIYLNGNISLNLMDNNTNTHLINKNIYKINSGNLNKRSIKTIDSFNNLNKIVRSGNVSKVINKGYINGGNTFPLINDKIDNKIVSPKRKIDFDKDIHIQHEKIFSNENEVFRPFIDDKINENKVNEHHELKNKVNEEMKQKLETSNDFQHSQPKNSHHIPNIKQNQLINNVNPQKHDNINNNLKNITLNIPSKSLILGTNNELKDNHLIHNIVHVHNSYIIPSKALLNVEKGINLQNHTSNNPHTLIVVNARKNQDNKNKN